LPISLFCWVGVKYQQLYWEYHLIYSPNGLIEFKSWEGLIQYEFCITEFQINSRKQGDMIVFTKWQNCGEGKSPRLSMVKLFIWLCEYKQVVLGKSWFPIWVNLFHVRRRDRIWCWFRYAYGGPVQKFLEYKGVSDPRLQLALIVYLTNYIVGALPYSRYQKGDMS
jgi:hypothetical protein